MVGVWGVIHYLLPSSKIFYLRNICCLNTIYISYLYRDSGEVSCMVEKEGELFCCSTNGSIRTYGLTHSGKNIPMVCIMILDISCFIVITILHTGYPHLRSSELIIMVRVILSFDSSITNINSINNSKRPCGSTVAQ